MARPTAPNRGDLRAVRPTGSRVSSAPVTGDPYESSPSDLDYGKITLRHVEGTDENGESTGAATIVVRFTCPYMQYVKDKDLARMRILFDIIKNTAVSMSKGPYTLKLLAEMGHPYATAPSTEDRVRRLRRSGHNVPRFQPGKAIGHIKGISGSVATLAVTNIQTGLLAASWSATVKRDDLGVIGELTNSAPYAWYLLDGTTKMIAHGPWDAVFKIHKLQYDGEWNAIVKTAFSRIPKAKRATLVEEAVA